ncbi:MAG: phosphate regulon sensor histidine kinase PhoR [Xanthomonadales bacterium]|nr:phosphate regulon sensor histidine kinase PhoR [Xanthomonadales bacterium]
MGNIIPKAWKASLLKLAGGLAVGALVGTLLGAPLASVAVVLALFLGWHLANAFRLHGQLKSNRRIAPIGGIGVWSDIFATLARRQDESRRRKRRLLSIVREFRNATAALHDGVLLLDQKLNILWFNPSAVEMLALSRRQDIGRRVTNLIRDPAVHTWLKDHDEHPEGVIIDAPSDPERKLRLRAFSYEQGQHLLLIRDITQIQLADRMRKDFVANVSHELRTPLTVISGYIETMSGEVDPEWQTVLDRLGEQTNRMRLIIDDLLTLSRLNEAKEIEEEVLVDVPAMLEKIATEARQLSGGKHEIEVDCEMRRGLRGSSKDLQSAFVNLVFNAVRYTQEGGLIRIRWFKNEDGSAVLSVQDNGPGIASQHLPRLTERFYRVSKDRSRATGGTGLGLAIVKNVLLLHQANLEIESEIGRGSEFRCVFPATRIARSFMEAS